MYIYVCVLCVACIYIYTQCKARVKQTYEQLQPSSKKMQLMCTMYVCNRYMSMCISQCMHVCAYVCLYVYIYIIHIWFSLNFHEFPLLTCSFRFFSFHFSASDHRTCKLDLKPVKDSLGTELGWECDERNMPTAWPWPCGNADGWDVFSNVSWISFECHWNIIWISYESDIWIYLDYLGFMSTSLQSNIDIYAFRFIFCASSLPNSSSLLSSSSDSQDDSRCQWIANAILSILSSSWQRKSTYPNCDSNCFASKSPIPASSSSLGAKVSSWTAQLPGWERWKMWRRTLLFDFQ